MKRSLKQAVFIVFFYTLAITSIAFPAQEIEGNIDDVARAILTYFPKVTGKITSINDGLLGLGLGGGQGLSEGILLTVFREEEAFYHPVTHVNMGKFESQVGTIEIVRLDPTHLSAIPINTVKEIRVGDLVRLPSTKIPLSIAVNSEKDHLFLLNEIASALGDTGRFQIDLLSPGSDFKAAFRRENRYHIKLLTRRNGERFSMNLQIQNTASGKQLAKLDVLIHQSEDSDLILEHLQYKFFEQRQQR